MRLLFIFFLVVALRAMGNDEVPFNGWIDSSLNVISYHITINEINFSSKELNANCEIILKKSLNSSAVRLDLIGFNVDSVFVNSNKIINYEKTDTTLTVPVPTNSDSINLLIYYRGKPFTDPSNFGGGFYITNNIAYNIGVGFSANPHNLGRAWFPCNDNFVDRATFSYSIHTPTTMSAFCNGKLIEVDTLSNTYVYHYGMESTIPPYLASIYISKNFTIKDTVQGALGIIPIEINVPIADTLKAKRSFINLKKIFHNFETRFGPYVWERIGFNAVPTVGGAMEHATNISFNQVFSTGDLQFESIFAHELSHHWFGDLITCETAEEMWLNEGMAVFSEFLYKEDLYSKQEAKNYIIGKHIDVLENAHISDGGYFPVNNVPHRITYGTTVYDKGGLVANTIRNQFSDSMFNAFLTQLFVDYSLKSINSEQLQTAIELYFNSSINDVFEAFVESAGFPDIRIDSIVTTNNNASYLCKVWMSKNMQQPINTVAINKMTCPVTLIGKQAEQLTLKIQFPLDSFILPFEPIGFIYNMNDDISADACGRGTFIIKSLGKKTFSNVYMGIDIRSFTDTSIVQIEHHYAPADTLSGEVVELSNGHYWTISGAHFGQVDGSMSFFYRKKFDDGLYSSNENELDLYYRKSAGTPWQKVNNATITTGPSATDGNGSITIQEIKFGDYTIGNDGLLGMNEHLSKKSTYLIIEQLPGSAVILKSAKKMEGIVSITNVEGKELYVEKVNSHTLRVDVSEWSKGVYIFNYIEKNQAPNSVKWILQ